jgi:hypothetical protein
MAAGGISHRYFFNSDASLKTTVAATYSQLDGGASMFNHALESTPYMDLESRHTNLILTSTFNRKFSNRFTNKTLLTSAAPCHSSIRSSAAGNGIEGRWQYESDFCLQ